MARRKKYSFEATLSWPVPSIPVRSALVRFSAGTERCFRSFLLVTPLVVARRF